MAKYDPKENNFLKKANYLKTKFELYEICF